MITLLFGLISISGRASERIPASERLTCSFAIGTESSGLSPIKRISSRDGLNGGMLGGESLS